MWCGEVGPPDDLRKAPPPRAAAGLMAHPNRTAEAALVQTLRSIVGRRHVLTRPGATRRYRQGYRFGEGPAAAVVRPGSLVEQWRVVQACVEAEAIVIMQAANTGLTGGSTPDGDDYDRPVVIISTRRLDGLHLIREGRQVICLPGATLYGLERALKPLGREPHSVIGSSCIGASVLGGVCNNSGGALVQRGPAYTEMALYARLGRDGRLELVNHLGIRLGDDPEGALARLERGGFAESDVLDEPGRAASDPDYVRHVREVDAPTPARFNADPRKLFEASGSAGKLIVFAVRLDTFRADADTAVFYIGTNQPARLTQLRRDILQGFRSLPVAGEYMHRDCFDIADRYGKDTVIAIERLGVDRLPRLFAIKARVDAALDRLPFGAGFSDQVMQAVGRLFPDHLPARLRAFRDRFEHHLLLKVAGPGVEEARAYLAAHPTSEAWDHFECTSQEGAKAFLNRFAAAGAAVRYRALHRRAVGGIVALDIALPRNTQDWVERLPPEIDREILHRLYYGHFFCQVFHQDYVVRKGCDALELEHRMLDVLDRRGAQYPAEHNVGHLYPAKPDLAEFYRELDPRNGFNPGVGQLSKKRDWG
jgi:D-lactate dehydrogenase (quinone)